MATTGFWMDLLAPLLKPLFGWTYNDVIAEGRKGLARYVSQQAAAATSVRASPVPQTT